MTPRGPLTTEAKGEMGQRIDPEAVAAETGLTPGDSGGRLYRRHHPLAVVCPLRSAGHPLDGSWCKGRRHPPSRDAKSGESRRRGHSYPLIPITWRLGPGHHRPGIPEKYPLGDLEILEGSASSCGGSGWSQPLSSRSGQRPWRRVGIFWWSKPTLGEAANRRIWFLPALSYAEKMGTFMKPGTPVQLSEASPSAHEDPLGRGLSAPTCHPARVGPG